MKICVTGHRPHRLWGYNVSDPNYQILMGIFERFLKNHGCDEALSGMALGVDTIFALAALNLKESGYPIRLRCVIPCKNQHLRWPNESKDRYAAILNKADIVDYVSDKNYESARTMQDRNEYLVNNSDIVVAVWDGVSSGGTYNCMRYAKSVGKPIYLIDPNVISPNNSVWIKVFTKWPEISDRIV